MQRSQVRSPTPDGFERDAGKDTSPVQAHANTAQVGENLVAEITATVEAFVRVTPHTIGRANSFGFGEDIIELNFDVSVHVMRVSVN